MVGGIGTATCLVHVRSTTLPTASACLLRDQASTMQQMRPPRVIKSVWTCVHSSQTRPSLSPSTAALSKSGEDICYESRSAQLKYMAPTAAQLIHSATAPHCAPYPCPCLS